MAVLICVGLLSACAVTRVDPPAEPAVPSHFKEGGAAAAAAGGASSPSTVPEAWWTVFNDPVLDDLERRLVVDNESLKATAAAVASARAAYEASRSAFWPTASLGFSGSRGATPDTGTGASLHQPSNTFSLTGTASWEIDLWGRLAQASDAARAGYQASQDDLAAARLSAQALLAQTYFSLRTADAQLALMARSQAAYQRSLDLTQARYDGGVAARTDVLQAQSQLHTVQAQAADLTAQRAQLEHAIAVLLGTPPSSLDLARDERLPEPPNAPTLLPASLLERRPDIAAAQRRVAAAYAQIGVADAAYLPDIVLSANAGYRGATLSRLISGPNLLWSLGASLAETLLDGGQRKLASAQARASAQQLTATYRQTVLTALQEVEDNLVLADQLQQEAGFQHDAWQAAQRNLEITLEQYRAGTVSYLNVVTAQTSALSSESAWLTVRNRQLAALNVLMKNIAGRWEPV